MRKIVVAEFLSLDGIMEDPKWTFSYWNDEIAKFKYDELFASGAHLLGRVTYLGFAEAWPARTDEEGFADRMNALPKYVVSTTLEKAEWNNSHLIRSNVAEEIRKLKQAEGQDLLVAGSATLVNFLIENNLVDVYHLLIYPIVIGSGKRLFKEGTQTKLILTESKAFNSGVVAQIYQPERSSHA
jgi:dihydrofolate reductase